MKLRITNNRKGSYGVEKADGGFVFIEPGETRVIDARAPDALFSLAFLDVVDEGYEGGAIPTSLAAKVETSPRAKPRKRSTRRKKAGK